MRKKASYSNKEDERIEKVSIGNKIDDKRS
jgi:hypothetical protein